VFQWVGCPVGWCSSPTADDAGHDREIEMTLGPVFLFLCPQTPAPNSGVRFSGLRTLVSGTPAVARRLWRRRNL